MVGPTPGVLRCAGSNRPRRLLQGAEPGALERSDTLDARSLPTGCVQVHREPVDRHAAVDPHSRDGGAMEPSNKQTETSMTAPKTTDARLVERVQRGDKRAFDLLVVKYQYRIQALVSRYVRDQDDIQDVVQDAFLKAYRALPRFRGESQFYTWLYRIAINTAKNFLVARSRRPPATDVDVVDAEFHSGGEALTDIDTPENELAGEQLRAAVFEALEALPEDLRTAVTLREFDGLAYEEIADIMECPVGTVRSRIFRAREAIDKVVRPLMER